MVDLSNRGMTDGRSQRVIDLFSLFLLGVCNLLACSSGVGHFLYTIITNDTHLH